MEKTKAELDKANADRVLREQEKQRASKYTEKESQQHNSSTLVREQEEERASASASASLTEHSGRTPVNAKQPTKKAQDKTKGAGKENACQKTKANASPTTLSNQKPKQPNKTNMTTAKNSKPEKADKHPVGKTLIDPETNLKVRLLDFLYLHASAELTCFIHVQVWDHPDSPNDSHYVSMCIGHRIAQSNPKDLYEIQVRMEPHKRYIHVYAPGEPWLPLRMAKKEFERLPFFCLNAKDINLCKALVEISAGKKIDKVFDEVKTKEIFPELFDQEFPKLAEPVCMLDHSLPATYEACNFAGYFDPGHNQRKYEKAKCSGGCDTTIPYQGTKKPSSRNPVYVCHSVSLHASSGNKCCFETNGFLCGKCYAKLASSDQPTSRRRRATTGGTADDAANKNATAAKRQRPK